MEKKIFYIRIVAKRDKKKLPFFLFFQHSILFISRNHLEADRSIFRDRNRRRYGC